MGTNYYVESDPCEHCGRGDGQIHFMKSFRIYQGFPEDNPSPWGPIRSVADWRNAIETYRLGVRDEYGTQHDPQEILDRVAATATSSAAGYEQHLAQYGGHPGHDFQDPAGYWFSDNDFS